MANQGFCRGQFHFSGPCGGHKHRFSIEFRGIVADYVMHNVGGREIQKYSGRLGHANVRCTRYAMSESMSPPPKCYAAHSEKYTHGPGF